MLELDHLPVSGHIDIWRCTHYTIIYICIYIYKKRFYFMFKLMKHFITHAKIVFSLNVFALNKNIGLSFVFDYDWVSGVF